MLPVIRALCLVAAPLGVMAASALQEQEDQMMKQVQSMIASVVKEKQPLTPAEETAIDLMIETLNDITLPAVHGGHEDEQKILDAAYGNLLGCSTKLYKDANAVESLAEESTSKYEAHGTCRGEESDLAFANKTAFSDLKQFLNGLPEPPVQEKPAKKYLGLTSWFQAGLEFFQNTGPMYLEKKKAYTDAFSTHATKKEECDKAYSDFESIACDWKGDGTDALSDYNSCWIGGEATFSEVTSAATDSSEQRKAEYKTAKKLLCWLDILKDLVASRTGKVPEGIDDSLKKCDNLEVDTDWLVLTNTTAPEKEEMKFLLSLEQETITLPGGIIPGVTCGDETGGTDSLYDKDSLYGAESK